MAQGAESFTTFTLQAAKMDEKINEIHEKVDRLRKMHGHFASQKAYFFPVFSCSLFLHPLFAILVKVFTLIRD